MSAKVTCEAHNGEHEITGDCEWPHWVQPPAPQPIVGHPLTIHD